MDVEYLFLFLFGPPLKKKLEKSVNQLIKNKIPLEVQVLKALQPKAKYGVSQ